MFEQLPQESSPWGIFRDRNGDPVSSGAGAWTRLPAGCENLISSKLYSKVDYQNRIEVHGIRTSRTWLCDLTPYETG